jgi:hypothetical protein
LLPRQFSPPCIGYWNFSFTDCPFESNAWTVELFIELLQLRSVVVGLPIS